MRFLFAVCFKATFLALMAIHGADSGTAIQPEVPKLPDLSALFKNMPAPMPEPMPAPMPAPMPVPMPAPMPAPLPAPLPVAPGELRLTNVH